MLKTALQWHNQGISTIPTVYRSKKPVVKYKQYLNQLPTLLNLAKWFLGAQRNIALITTEYLVVLDFDNPIEYGYWFCYQMKVNPDLINTYMVITSRGLHLYYWVDETFDKIGSSAYTLEALNLISKNKSIKGLKTPKVCLPYEIKSHGSLVTIPPSIHQSGIPYRAINKIDDIKKVSNIQELLTFSYVKFKWAMPKRIDNDPWRLLQVNEFKEKIDLLALFPDAIQTDEKGRYWKTDCPMHGHKDNFWLDVEWNICGCYAGCGQFLAIDIFQLVNEFINGIH